MVNAVRKSSGKDNSSNRFLSSARLISFLFSVKVNPISAVSGIRLAIGVEASGFRLKK